MKKLLLLIVIFMFAGAVLMQLIREDSGYLLLRYGDTVVESSFWFALTLVIVSVFLLWLIYRLLRRLLASLGGSLSWLAHSRHQRSVLRTHSGLIHFIEGNWRAAKKELLGGAKGADEPLINYLAAARSAYELGQRDETQFLLHQAEKVSPHNELAVALSQARIQLRDKKYEQCLATLERARQHAPEHPVVLDLLEQVYWQLKDWDALVALLPAIRAAKLYSVQQQIEMEENIYLAHLRHHARASAPSLSVETLAEVWKKIPKALQKSPRLIKLYAALLLEIKQDVVAEPILRRALQKHWHEALIELYGKVQAEDPKEQLIIAEQWLRERPGDAALMLALGRICMRNQLWGKARDYFEHSLALSTRPDTYAELAALMAQLGEHEKSTDLYQKGLLLMTR